jgi:chitin deacetylase
VKRYLLFWTYTEWLAGFPAPGLAIPDSKMLPAAWVDSLNSAVAAGKIPNVSVSYITPGANPVYPAGLDPTSPEVCSATYKCRIPGDIWDSPEGVFASGFDDGPGPVSGFKKKNIYIYKILTVILISLPSSFCGF